MSIASDIQQLVAEKLSGTKIDPVGVVDQLLALSQQQGEIRCQLADDQALSFVFPKQASVVRVPLAAAKGKLRMLCARLGVLSAGADATSIPAHGDGVIELNTPTANAHPRWRVQYQNTPSEQWFSIQSRE
jgi:hypothetical protein